MKKKGSGQNGNFDKIRSQKGTETFQLLSSASFKRNYYVTNMIFTIQLLSANACLLENWKRSYNTYDQYFMFLHEDILQGAESQNIRHQIRMI